MNCVGAIWNNLCHLVNILYHLEKMFVRNVNVSLEKQLVVFLRNASRNQLVKPTKLLWELVANLNVLKVWGGLCVMFSFCLLLLHIYKKNFQMMTCQKRQSLLCCYHLVQDYYCCFLSYFCCFAIDVGEIVLKNKKAKWNHWNKYQENKMVRIFSLCGYMINDLKCPQNIFLYHRYTWVAQLWGK